MEKEGLLNFMKVISSLLGTIYSYFGGHIPSFDVLTLLVGFS